MRSAHDSGLTAPRVDDVDPAPHVSGISQAIEIHGRTRVLIPLELVPAFADLLKDRSEALIAIRRGPEAEQLELELISTPGDEFVPRHESIGTLNESAATTSLQNNPPDSSTVPEESATSPVVAKGVLASPDAPIYSPSLGLLPSGCSTKDSLKEKPDQKAFELTQSGSNYDSDDQTSNGITDPDRIEKFILVGVDRNGVGQAYSRTLGLIRVDVQSTSQLQKLVKAVEASYVHDLVTPRAYQGRDRARFLVRTDSFVQQHKDAAERVIAVHATNSVRQQLDIGLDYESSPQFSQGS